MNDLIEGQTQESISYCPHCQFFGSDCNPDTNDFSSPCSAFQYDTDFDFDSEGE